MPRFNVREWSANWSGRKQPSSKGRVFGFSLEHLRTAAGWAAAVMLGGGISASTGDHSHRAMTYLFWYGCAGLFVGTAIVLTSVIERRRPKPSAGPTVKYRGFEVTGRPSESTSELLQAVRASGLLVETPETADSPKDEATEP